MAVMSHGKQIVEDVLHNAFIEGLIKGVLGGAVFMGAILLTDELVTGLIIGGFGGLCVAESLTEKFHCDDCKAWHGYTGLAIGLLLGVAFALVIGVESWTLPYLF